MTPTPSLFRVVPTTQRRGTTDVGVDLVSCRPTTLVDLRTKEDTDLQLQPIPDLRDHEGRTWRGTVERCHDQTRRRFLPPNPPERSPIHDPLSTHLRHKKTTGSKSSVSHRESTRKNKFRQCSGPSKFPLSPDPGRKIHSQDPDDMVYWCVTHRILSFTQE